MSCPICGKPTEKSYRPFCSKRCADVDLARWLGGHYAVPGESVDAEEHPQEASESDQTKPRLN
ncbi:MAG: DNA gyrase inhibitor YacG [Pseudomonadota bacterium]